MNKFRELVSKLNDALEPVKEIFGRLSLAVKIAYFRTVVKLRNLLGYHFYVVFDNKYVVSRLESRPLKVLGCMRPSSAINKFEVMQSFEAVKIHLVEYDIRDDVRTTDINDLAYFDGKVVRIP